MNTTLSKIDQKTRKIGKIYIWNPMTTGLYYVNIDLRHQYRFLSLSRRRSSAQNVPSGEERGETDVFAA